MTAFPARTRGFGHGTPVAWVAVCLSVVLLAFAALPVRAQASAAIPAMTSPVVDTTGTLDAATRSQLEAQARALQQRKGSQLQVLVVASTAPEDIDSYAVRAYEQFKLGRKDVDDGVLVVVAKDDRRVRIEVGYGLEGAITDAQSGRIIQEYLAPKFRTGDYAGGLVDATAMLVKLIDGEPLPPPMARQTQDDGGGEEGWVLAFFIAIFGGQFVRAVLGRLPALVRGLASGLVVGGIAWLLSLAWWLVGLTALIGLFVGLLGGSGGQFVRSGGWGGYGGGGWGGGSGGGGGGGWSGGGGSSGGGGASGSW
ncbi:TPM domain-containing protein [Lysobacter antibioticus]|uniref:TPM domain-containing protein n=1 Tax=Lysobacter antibioticus TaxID=84531 RepID=UPI0009E091CD|nr:TPM domain-containing protein [Lysobacter antibioticus]